VREKGDWLHKIDRRPIRLTSGPLAFDAPQPSLDGKRIFAVGAQLRSELSRYDAKSGQFLPYLGGISAVGVSLSVDGQWVAYLSFPEGYLWRSRIDGSEKLQLTSSETFTDTTHWSPDGRQIAYIAHSTGEEDRICLVGKDGGSPRIVYRGHSLMRPSWRSDGSAIVFAETPTSPVDGKKLKLYDFRTQAWQEFAPPAGVGFTEWSSDGRYLYFDNGWSTDPAVYRFRISDHNVEQVTSLKTFRRAAWGELPWLGLTRNGDPLLMRDVGSQEVYALDFEEP
jgi:Tol biopolymer transport system component